MSDPSFQRLAGQACIPCTVGAEPLRGELVDRLLAQLGNGWQVIDGHHLTKTYRFASFKDALAFVVRVGEMADLQGHHPDVHLSWGKARLDVWTHKIDGLTESDFFLAAKAESLYSA